MSTRKDAFYNYISGWLYLKSQNLQMQLHLLICWSSEILLTISIKPCPVGVLDHLQSPKAANCMQNVNQDKWNTQYKPCRLIEKLGSVDQTDEDIRVFKIMVINYNEWLTCKESNDVFKSKLAPILLDDHIKRWMEIGT